MTKNKKLAVVKQSLVWGGGTTLLVLIVVQLAGVFDDKIAPGDGSESRHPKVEGTAVAAVQVEEPVVERYPGTVGAVRKAGISSRIISRVREILIRPGQRVTKDEPLVILDSRDLESRYSQEQESLVGAEARMKEAKVSYGRMKNVAEGAISRTQIDQAEAAYESAGADVKTARERVDEAKIRLSFATIRAPFDGIVIDKYMEPGDLASPGSPLLEVYDPSSMRLEAWVRETIAVGLKRNDKVGVLLDAFGKRIEGTVEEIVPQAEAGSRSFLVKVTLPKHESLYPGMFGRLLLPSGTMTRVLVPAKAVSRVGQLHFVVLANERNTRRLVVPGEARGDKQMEILAGVAAGESVIVPNRQP